MIYFQNEIGRNKEKTDKRAILYSKGKRYRNAWNREVAENSKEKNKGALKEKLSHK